LLNVTAEHIENCYGQVVPISAMAKALVATCYGHGHIVSIPLAWRRRVFMPTGWHVVYRCCKKNRDLWVL